MRTALVLTFCFLTIFLIQCSDTASSEFEKASGIMLPDESKQLDAHDDGKFVKTNAYSINSQALKAFIDEHGFEKFSKINVPQFWGINNLDEKPDFNNLDGFYYKTGTKDSLSWIYLVDLNSARLWTEIKYPGKPAY